MRRMWSRSSLLLPASLLIAANSSAKGRSDDHSVPLPPQPAAPPGIQSEVPTELDALPPPPARPPSARRRPKESRARTEIRAPVREAKPDYQRESTTPQPAKDSSSSGKWYGA